MASTLNHNYWMDKALGQARMAWGKTSPNPLVGALVVKNGKLLGAGFHARAGSAHAEVAALAAAGNSAAGADLYVTLEPCCTHGRTPPCTDAILAAGIKRVFVGCLDPNPRHSGRGVEILRGAGLEVRTGILQAACRELNEAFFTWITQARPFVLLKLAMTLDGRIATAGGKARWISGKPAREYTQRLRQWADAVMVGGETLRLDRPRLTVRTPADWEPQPLPIIWSRAARLPAAALSGLAREPLVVAPQTTEDWQTFLRDLGARGITALLMEGGGELAAAALHAGVVDKIAFFLAPKILGGRGSRPGVGGLDPQTMADALPVRGMKIEMIGRDLLVTGYPVAGRASRIGKGGGRGQR